MGAAGVVCGGVGSGSVLEDLESRDGVPRRRLIRPPAAACCAVNGGGGGDGVRRRVDLKSGEGGGVWRRCGRAVDGASGGEGGSDDGGGGGALERRPD
jgi:hypothetical protein